MQPHQRSRLPRPVDRNELVRRARAHLDLHGYSRIELFVIIALAGVSTVGYVLYLAPALFAEVLVDGVIVATVSRRVAGLERRDWTATVLSTPGCRPPC